MVFVVDVGNSNIVFGVYYNDELKHIIRTTTERQKTDDEYVILIRNLLLAEGVRIEDIEGCVLSSVVPPLTGILRRALHRLTGKMPLILGPGVRTGLNIKTENPSELGADIVATAVAGMSKYPLPLVIADLGTATKLSAIGKNGEFLGVIIQPGVRISADALSNIASQLPDVALEAPKKVLGTNTVDSMQSGIVFGAASTLDGLLLRIEEEIGSKVTAVMTGGIAKSIHPHCRSNYILDEHLILDGLYQIYVKNMK